MSNLIVNLVSVGVYDRAIPWVFDDTIRSVYALLIRAGYQTFISHNVIAPEALNIIWGVGSHFSPSYEEIESVAKSENSVIFNMEQIALGNSFVNHEYLKFLSKYRVLDYNQTNVTALKLLLPDVSAVEFPVIPSPEFASDFGGRNFQLKDNYSISFFGAKNDRRTRILEYLAEGNFKILNVKGKYGAQLSEAIQNTNLCLNIHALDTAVFEVARCLRPLAMGIPVISEFSQMPQNIDWGESGVYFCSYQDVPAVCEQLAGDPKLVLELVRMTLNFIHSPKWPELARSALDAIT